jgi:hypothetical protein
MVSRHVHDLEGKDTILRSIRHMEKGNTRIEVPSRSLEPFERAIPASRRAGPATDNNSSVVQIVTHPKAIVMTCKHTITRCLPFFFCDRTIKVQKLVATNRDIESAILG